MPTLTIGDGKTYSSHVLAVAAVQTAISGDWTGAGIYTLETYAKSGQYLDDYIDFSTSFANADSSNHPICNSMVNHLGSKSGGNKIAAPSGASFVTQDLGPYGEMYGYVISVNGTATTSNTTVVALLDGVFKRNIIADVESSYGSNYWYAIFISAGATDLIIRNNFVQNTYSPYGCSAIGSSAASDNGIFIDNNTICNLKGYRGRGFLFWSTPTYGSVRNNVVLNMIATAASCYYRVPATNASNNVSTDTSAPGTSYIRNATASDELISDTLGSEDLHLKAGADSIDSGYDYSGSFTDEIDNGVRVLWDRGADGYGVVPAAGGIRKAMQIGNQKTNRKVLRGLSNRMGV